MAESAQARTIKVFVHLGHGFGGRTWADRHALGLIPGLNDRLAYGYYHAAGNGWSVEYSQDARETHVRRLCRLALRRVLGFDLIHAWRNRRRLFAADIVWTHTELENLAVLLLFRARSRRSRPKIIANCVWLFDYWPGLSWPRRVVYRELLRHTDALTTFSPANIKVAKTMLPGVRSEYILWGATTEDLKRPDRSPMHHPLRIASLGSDIHRDWKTLIKAFGNRERYEVRIGSTRINPKLVAGVSNVALLSVATANDVKALYEWADIVVVSLKPNLHASGITVILESVILAVPLVCTDTGGLRAYFSPAEVCYVPASAPVAMRVAVEELAMGEERRSSMLVNAQQRLLAANLTTKGFAERHRRLSEELLRQDPKYSVVCGAARRIA
ncbi:MAG: glycosyl transferase [Candidatus Binataceae bacterium]